MKRNKWIALCLAGCLALALTACGSQTTPGTSSSGENSGSGAGSSADPGAVSSAQSSASSQEEQETLVEYAVEGLGTFQLPEGFAMESGEITEPLPNRYAIFQKDGYNMARRSPIAHGLDRQLELLDAQGYRVVPVSELLELSPFLDVGQDTACGQNARRLLEAGWCVAFRDNSLRKDTVLTRGELAMMAFGWEGVAERVARMDSRTDPCADVKCSHPYAGAVALAMERGVMTAPGGKFRPEEPVSARELADFFQTHLNRAPEYIPDGITHEGFFQLAAGLM